jgi:antitoxin HicB
MEKILYYNIIFRPEPEGGFTVMVPALPGCITYGKDLKEAKSMAKDAIIAFIGSLKKHNESIPTSEGDLVSSLNIAYA